MSMDTGGAKGGVKADINVTPLVDVMLVLLIIMMLIAPMLQKGVDVKLPQAAIPQTSPRRRTRRSSRSRATSSSSSNAVPVPKAISPTRVTTLLEDKTEKIVLIKADEDVDYGAVMEAMDDLRKAGSRTSA